MSSLRFSSSLCFFFLLLLFVFPFCLSCPPDSVQLNQNFIGKIFTKEEIQASNSVIHVNENEEFAIRLHSNPSTGYSWSIISADLPLIGCSYFRSCVGDKCPVGSGGMEMFGWKAVNNINSPKNTFNLQLKYVRPWEQNNGVSDLVVTVIIDSSSL